MLNVNYKIYKLLRGRYIINYIWYYLKIKIYLKCEINIFRFVIKCLIGRLVNVYCMWICKLSVIIRKIKLKWCNLWIFRIIFKVVIFFK